MDMGAVCARDAALFYAPPPVLAPEQTWRGECRGLFAQRGTFFDKFCGREAPPPEVKDFSIAVGCRFRPPGGDAVTVEILPMVPMMEAESVGREGGGQRGAVTMEAVLQQVLRQWW